MTSPFRRNRLGVTIPARVLSGNEVVGILGSPLPVRASRSLNARSFRSSSRCPTRGSDSSGYPLIGFDSPSRLSITACQRALARWRLSWGSCPFSAWGGGNQRPVVRTGSPVSRDCADASHASATLSLTGSLNLSATCSSLHLPAISQAGNAPGVRPSRGSPPTQLRRLVDAGMPSHRFSRWLRVSPS